MRFLLTLQFAESGSHGKPRGTNGRKKTAKDSHHESKDHTFNQKLGSDFDRKSKMGESLTVHRSGGGPVERKNGNTADDPANERDQQRFHEKRDDDRRSGESQSTHGSDFAATFSNGRIHGIEGSEHRPNGHDERDESAQTGNERGHPGGLLGVIIHFARHVHIQSWIGSDRVLELLQRSGRSEVYGDRLKKSVGPFIGPAEQMRIGPNFRIEGAAASVKDSHDLPPHAA